MPSCPSRFSGVIRHWLMPKRGAKIVGFTWPGPNRYSLDYPVNNQHGFVNYAMNEDRNWTFNFIEPDGTKTTEHYPPAPKTRLTGYINANNGGNVKVAWASPVWRRASWSRSSRSRLPPSRSRRWR